MVRSPSSSRIPWPEIALSIGATVIFFSLLELGLRVAGIDSVHVAEDPFVGFSRDVPLFIAQADPEGREILATASNKRSFFNLQRFPRQKSPETCRIFCLGGSTTYGRPYDDRTSFAGWLREVLPVIDPETKWEVINAGGISYASYRVASLMEELAEYEPDLFIVYTGHNEFLEERTYPTLRSLPPLLTSTLSRLSRSRTWAALSLVVDRFQSTKPSPDDGRLLLPDRVTARLDRAAGLNLYERDDELGTQVLAHYRLSLERIAKISRAAGAQLILVTPASNLKDFSPFKSQHTAGLSQQDQVASRKLIDEALAEARQGHSGQVLAITSQAITLDPRYADLHYVRGQALLARQQFQHARAAFERALEEDVCPLRALPISREIIREVASQQAVPLVDFPAVLDSLMQQAHGYSIPGDEYFVDHVHPTVEGHRILAARLIDTMVESGIITNTRRWNDDALAAAAAKINERLPPGYHAQALAKLALTLDWAGKKEQSRRLAFEALEYGVEDPLIFLMVARHLATEGRVDESLGYLRRALAADSRNPSTHLQLGLLLMGQQEMEAAAAHFYMAQILEGNNPQASRYLGFVMTKRNRYGPALRAYLEAERLDPSHLGTRERVAALRAEATPRSRLEVPTTNGITTHPAGEWKTVSQVRPDGAGGYLIDGIGTEWYPAGTLKRFSDYKNGLLDGAEVLWDPTGRVIARNVYENGILVGSRD